MPPPSLIVAAKLVRGHERDIEDAVWWTCSRKLSEDTIGDAIEQLPNEYDRETAWSNVVFIKLAADRREKAAPVSMPGCGM